jgi:hypothetical protein
LWRDGDLIKLCYDDDDDDDYDSDDVYIRI